MRRRPKPRRGRGAGERRGALLAAREVKYGRSYVVRDELGELVASLSFRDARAVEAVAAGRVRWRWHRTYSPWFYDAYLVLECDDYGIGHGTLSTLAAQRWCTEPLIARSDVEGPARLTPLGRRVLAAIRELPGVEVGAS